MRRALTTLLAAFALLAATPAQLDSQYVLQRYALQIDAVPLPKNIVFIYTVSQAGPQNIEQRHQVYRSGLDVRDETLAVDGVTLPRKRVNIGRREDRYAIDRLAPRSTAYELLFVHSVRDGSHLDYVYDATPGARAAGDASIDRVTIDGRSFLPRELHFHTSSANAKGTGTIRYAPFGRYWLPVEAEVSATVNGKPAREHIAWSDYRFPESLPDTTFHARPLPTETPSD
jgi:hypothetical protein